SASVITADRTPRSAEGVADLLGDVPGVTVSRLGGVGAPALLSLRGSSWEQVAIYLDGIHLNLAAGGGVDLSTLPIGDLARVEVYRGATPIAFGASAIGGVVSVETARPRANRATIEMGGGSFGTWLGGGSASLATDRAGLYVGIHTLRSTGDFAFLDDKGTAFDPSDDETLTRQNNRIREVDGVVRGAVALGARRELSLVALGFDRDQGLAGYPRYATTRSTLRTRRGVASVAYESRDDLGVHSRLRAQVYGYGLEQHFVDPLAEMSASPTDARDRTRALGGTTRARWRPAAWIEPAVLVDARRESFVPTDLVTGDRGVVSTRMTAVGGAETTLHVDAARLAIVPSLRLEITRDHSAGRDNFGKVTSRGAPIVRALPVARLAITQSPREGLRLRANLGRYARLPTFLELYGNTGMIRGNRALEPEHGTTADLGAALTGSRGAATLAADVAGFASFTDELIQFQQNAYGIAVARNIGRARVLGVESSTELRYRHAVLYAQATLTDARDQSASAAAAGKQLPYRPWMHVTVRPELRRLPVLGVELGAYVELDATSGNYVDPANLVRVPSRVLLGAGASAGFADGHVRLIASVTNLTRASENDLLSYPLPGRAFFLTVVLATDSASKEP
ncbi:MAG: TonB-dependent receptor, partial [Myxococcales bacterium]|nr:TonB-dependent receptor [Myxococcales bacterium]